MKTNLYLLVVWFIHCDSARAQSLRYSIAQPYISLSAYSKEQNDPLSFTGNQAALAQTRLAGFGIYGERRFMLEETSAYCFAAAIPTQPGHRERRTPQRSSLRWWKPGYRYTRPAGGVPGWTSCSPG